MRTAFAVLSVIVATLVPSSASAWGTAAHRYIMGRAIDLLPSELKPFFSHYRDEVVLRSTDPDLWRLAGWEDDPNHFLDLGVPEFGPPPFVALPRELGAAIEKFGMATLKRDGMLPWREAEEFGNLRRAFAGFARHVPYAPSDVVFFAAVAGHYMQDAHQPLHATDNYDGQLTGQNGLHARFESDLFDRFDTRLTIVPGPLTTIPNVRDAAFDTLVASHDLVASVLKADRDAAAGKDVYDYGYFEKFFAQMKPLLERQLAASISQTASLLTTAWVQAGKPAVTIDVRQGVQKVRPQRPQ